MEEGSEMLLDGRRTEAGAAVAVAGAGAFTTGVRLNMSDLRGSDIYFYYAKRRMTSVVVVFFFSFGEFEIKGRAKKRKKRTKGDTSIVHAKSRIIACDIIAIQCHLGFLGIPVQNLARKRSWVRTPRRIQSVFVHQSV